MKTVSIESMRASFERARAKAHSKSDMPVEYGHIYNFFIHGAVSVQFTVGDVFVVRRVRECGVESMARAYLDNDSVVYPSLYYTPDFESDVDAGFDLHAGVVAGECMNG